MMLVIGLAFLLVVTDPRQPRPSDEALLAMVVDHAPGAVVVTKRERPMPADIDGARGLCGTIRIGGTLQPFIVYTHWRPAGSVDGDRWATLVRAPRSDEDEAERKAVGVACQKSDRPTTPQA